MASLHSRGSLAPVPVPSSTQYTRISKPKMQILSLSYYEPVTVLGVLEKEWGGHQGWGVGQGGISLIIFLSRNRFSSQCPPSLLPHFPSEEILSCLFSDKLSALVWTSSASTLWPSFFALFLPSLITDLRDISNNPLTKLISPPVLLVRSF